MKFYIYLQKKCMSATRNVDFAVEKRAVLLRAGETHTIFFVQYFGHVDKVYLRCFTPASTPHSSHRLLPPL